MGLPPGYLPAEYEVGLKDCYLLRVQALQMAGREEGHCALRQHPGWRFFNQLHGE